MLKALLSSLGLVKYLNHPFVKVALEILPHIKDVHKLFPKGVGPKENPEPLVRDLISPMLPYINKRFPFATEGECVGLCLSLIELYQQAKRVEADYKLLLIR